MTEVQADDTPAIDAVVNADKKRLALLNECRTLEKLQQDGDDSTIERLKQVYLQQNHFVFNCMIL